MVVAAVIRPVVRVQGHRPRLWGLKASCAYGPGAGMPWAHALGSQRDDPTPTSVNIVTPGSEEWGRLPVHMDCCGMDFPSIDMASRNKCHATSNRCVTSSNKKLLVTSALLLVTGALLVLVTSASLLVTGALLLLGTSALLLVTGALLVVTSALLLVARS